MRRSGACITLYLLTLLLIPPPNDPSWASAEIRGCNRTIRNSVGWIRWTGRMGRCIVRIRAPLRDPQVIEVKVRRLQVGFLKEARCEGAYFQFSDSLNDPDDEAGRYCGHVTGNATRLFLRRGPDLTIILSSDAQFASANPVIFSAQFSVLPIRLAVERHRGFSASSSPTCPVECIVRDERRTCRLTSPGYPGVYPRGIRCRVALESSAGRFRIGGQPEDLFDLMNYTDREGCPTENCEDSLEALGSQPGPPSGGPARMRNRTEEGIVVGTADDRPRGGNERNGSATRRADETNGRLTRRRHHEKKTARSRGKQYRESGDASDTSEPRHRVKSMRSKITRKDERRVAPDRYLDGEFERREDGMAIDGSATAPKHEHPDAENRWSVNVTCDGDYLALLENVNGKILEVSRFCGVGRVPRILSRGKNVILEFLARRDGTVTHDGFRVTLHEERAAAETRRASCTFVYRSTERSGRENIKSPRSWYPPNTVCTYRFLGRAAERVSVHVKILRNVFVQERPESKRNFSLNYCPGNEIAVYNGAQANGSALMWSYCDASHWDINNIQVPLTSSGNELLIRYHSAKGSYDGQGFTYAISYKFVRREEKNATARRARGKHRSISLRPVDLSVLNLNDTDGCNCNFDNRMGTFKNWFVVLVVLGIVSFLGAIVTIVALIVKFTKIRTTEKKLLHITK